MSIKIGINQNTVFQCGTEEFIKGCGEAGFTAVELRIDKLKEALYYSGDSIKSLLEKYKIKVVALNALYDTFLVPESNIKALYYECKMIGELCNKVGCNSIIAVTSSWNDSKGTLPQREVLIKMFSKRLAFISDIFFEYGVKVILEPVGYPGFIVNDIKIANEIVSQNPKNDSSVLIDIHNLFYNNVKPENIKENKFMCNSLFHINDTVDKPIKDLDVCYDRAFPGDGIANVVDWVSSAIDCGFKGCFSLELFNIGAAYSWNMNKEVNELWTKPSEEALKICYNKMKNFADKNFGGIEL